jgi:type IV pilus assembly protein PilB
MKTANQPLADIVCEVAGVSKQDIERATAVQQETHEALAQILVNMGLLSERDKARCLGIQWGVPFVDLSERPPDKELFKLIPRHLLQRFRVVPIASQGSRLSLAMVNPLDIYAIDQLRLVSGMDIHPLIGTEDDINNALAQDLGIGEEIGQALQQVAEEVGGDSADITVEQSAMADEELSLDRLREMADDAPVVRLVNLIIHRAVRDKASDIHLQPEANRFRVRFRIDGILHDKMVLPKGVQAALVSRVKVMAEMDISEKRAPQDGRMSLRLEQREYDLRVSTYPGVNGEKVVMRVLDKRGVQAQMHRLGLSASALEEFEQLITKPHGIICVTGPTGSGKSTTLYSVLNKINSPEQNLMTIEDPVEYQLAGLTQAQVNARAGVTFATALRTILRQDPDIILVGEMRDFETATIAIEAALTGHLVLSTLHTNDAPGAVTRLLEMGIEPFLTASSVIGVVAQRLVRVICPKCKEAYTPPAEAFRRLNLAMDTESVSFYRGRGCQHCTGSGYKGRIGVFEVMIITDGIRELILRKAPAHAIRQESLQNGMVPLKQDAMQKVLEGITTMEEALRVVYTE